MRPVWSSAFTRSELLSLFRPIRPMPPLYAGRGSRRTMRHVWSSAFTRSFSPGEFGWSLPRSPRVADSALEAAGSLHQIDERWQAGTIVNRQCCDRRHRPSNVCTKRKRCLFRDTHETVNVGTMSPAAGPLTCQPSPSVEERPLMLFGPAVGNTKLLFIWMMERVLRISGADCTMGA